MDTNLPNYGISELDVAYNNFKEENKKILKRTLDDEERYLKQLEQDKEKKIKSLENNCLLMEIPYFCKNKKLKEAIEKIKQKINFYKTCEKPRRLMAVLAPTFDQKNLEVEFYTKEWAAVLGLAVALTNPEVKCQISLKESKLQELTCSHWSFLIEQNQMSSTEVRLQTWQFNRTAKDQFILKGGFFKDLIQSKKIEIHVPLAGQIKLIEKELEVKDDFAAEKLKYDLAQPVETQKEQAAQSQNTSQGEHHNEHQKEIASQKKQLNKVTFEKKQKEDDYKKWIEQGQNQEQNQENQQQLEQQGSVEAIEQNSSESSEQNQNEVETHVPVPQNFNENQQQPQDHGPQSPSDQQSGGVPQLPGRGR